MAGADRLAFDLAAPLKFKCRLELTLEIVRAAQRDLGFFHQLEERRLHTAAAHIAAHHVAGGSELVDLVDVNDAKLREANIAIGLMHQLSDEILDVAADITGLAELGRVRLHEGNFNQIGNVLDEVGFSDTGRADEDNVLFRVLGFFGALRVVDFEPANVIDVVIVIAHGNGEDLLRFLLFDHEPIEVRLDVAREKVEDKTLAGLPRWLFLLRLGALGLGESGEGNLVTEVGFHEFGELGLQFFR